MKVEACKEKREEGQTIDKREKKFLLFFASKKSDKKKEKVR